MSEISDEVYSIKMRASKIIQERPIHISGAEKIISKEEVPLYVPSLIQRALNHSKGQAENIHVKVEKLNPNEIQKINALPVSTIDVKSSEEGWAKIEEVLNALNIKNAKKIFDLFKETYSMRGAMLLDINDFERLEPSNERGVRVTYMDYFCENKTVLKQEQTTKNAHFKEALALASKVINHPNIIAEICVSDDPDYVIGYIATKKIGYMRILKLKEMHEPYGGRIFLYSGKKEEVAACIHYLEHEPIWIIPPKNFNGNDLNKNQNFFTAIDSELQTLKSKNLYRTTKEFSSAQSKKVILQDREYLMFASNNYLDFCNEIQIKNFAKECLERYGVGSGGSRLTTGSSLLTQKLERQIAQFKNTENAIVFNTGYMANVGTISSIAQKDWVIFSDSLNHASIIDGCRLSGAQIVIYEHNNMLDLERKIKAYPNNKRLVVSDSVFSMDGDIVNLPELIEISKKYHVISMIDEAHATGVLGKSGRGTAEYFGLKTSADITLGTLSKAIGSEGGFVCGNNNLIEYLKNKARSFIFSTALSPAVLGASIKALELMENDFSRTTNLQKNIQFFCNALNENGVSAHSQTAIIPLIVGAEEKAMQLSQNLLNEGIYISAIRYPTVAKGQARLRIALMSSHTQDELFYAAQKIATEIKKLKD